MHNNIKTNSLQAWLLAARPKTLTAAAVPVAIGAAYAFSQMSFDQFRLCPIVLCFLFAFVMQIDANFVNDYVDCLRGNDKPEERLGPPRACSEGWITLGAMRIAIALTTMAACLLGFPLILFGGYEMILVGAVCVLFCFLYTTLLAHRGLGDVLVLLFFGIVPVCATFYVSVPKPLQTITLDLVLISIACGLVIDTLLILNNYRDRDKDKADGKQTLIVRIGEKWGRRLYLLVGIAGEIIMFYEVYIHVESILGPLAMVIYLFFHFHTYEKMLEIRQGKALNKVLGMTARNIFIFGALSVFALLY